ncbi:MAG: Multifunctional pyrimidine synthesis protein CAD [Alectoria sarmentosa]|nr:MAG: Multifunctional pyrimidine synthesis protein CAD [Alectoria sarmentosa]
MNQAMFTRLQRPTMGLLSVGTKPVMGGKSIMSGLQTRSFATVEPNTPRQQPTPSRQRTPVSFDTANLTIRNGPVFNGKSFGAKSNVSGEAVFTTSLVGYPESLTDPSYRGQILVFTQPLIGNYGVPSSARDENGLLKYFESPNIQAVGVVVADVATNYSHWTAVESLSEWCAREGVPAITGVDTRAIVTYLREQGSTLAKITIGEEYDEEQDEAFVDPEQINLVRKVSTKQPFHVSSGTGDMHVALIDCGVKENILRSLVGRGCSVTCFPFDYPLEKVGAYFRTPLSSRLIRNMLYGSTYPQEEAILTGNWNIAHHFDGVFISNGPGDPTHCVNTVHTLRTLFQTSQLPIFGICLGHQLLALAAGARTIKLKYGNRAHNIPCLDLTTGRVHITSQNHGYAVDAQTLPSDFKEFFVNLNDSSNEGIIHQSRPIFSTQFHPEARGGPLDSSYLFDNYLESVKRYKDNQTVLQPNRDNRPNPLLVDLLAKERVGVVPTLGMANMARANAAMGADAEPETRAAAAA